MHLAPKQVRPATRLDFEALPPTWRGEILDDELYQPVVDVPAPHRDRRGAPIARRDD
jgi:hypothetical protein